MTDTLQLHYINGFNSGVEYRGQIASQKARFFCDAGAASGWRFMPHNADYYTRDDMDRTLAQVTDSLKRASAPALAMGTSLGGLVSLLALARLDRSDVAAVLINPVLVPDEELLVDMLDTTVTNWVSGREHWVDPAIKLRLGEWVSEVPDILERFGDRVQVHLDADDEVLSSLAAADLCRPYCDVRWYPDGNHRFAHYAEAWPAIKAFAEKRL